ncbi:hypothetical protein ON010_g7693 [Phytophthora cinnamomi]|nr:hypothetical protein ON010_g7693 [Phytophthora cinnamomi]
MHLSATLLGIASLVSPSFAIMSGYHALPWDGRAFNLTVDTLSNNYNTAVLNVRNGFYRASFMNSEAFLNPYVWQLIFLGTGVFVIGVDASKNPARCTTATRAPTHEMVDRIRAWKVVQHGHQLGKRRNRVAFGDHATCHQVAWLTGRVDAPCLRKSKALWQPASQR